MTITKRKTSKGSYSWYYRFMRKGVLHTGVCEGCTTEIQAKKIDESVQKTWDENAREDMESDVLEKIIKSRKRVNKLSLQDSYKKLPKTFGKKRSVSENHLKQQERYWLDFVAFLEGQSPPVKYIGTITEEHANGYWQYLCENGKYKKAISFKSGRKIKEYTSQISKISNRTCNSYLGILKSIFQRFMDLKLVSENPFARIKKLLNEQEEREAFSDKELIKIKNNADPFIYAIFIIGLSTGLREGDICTLKWDEIDMENQIISKRTKKTGVKVMIPILPQLYKFLSGHFNKTGNGEFVLPEHAEMYKNNQTGISWRFKTFLKKMGIEATKKVDNRSRSVSIKDVHSLRHTFCSLAGINNIPLVIVQSIVGHMSPAMTEHYQKHAELKDKKKHFKKMPAFLQDRQIEESLSKTRKKLIKIAKTRPDKHVDMIVKYAENIKND